MPISATADSSAASVAVKLNIVVYEDEVPAFVEKYLVALHESLYSTVFATRLFNPDARISTYIAYRNGKPIQVFLFSRTGNRVDVLNDVFKVEANDIDIFCDCLFDRYKSISAISFKRVQVGLCRLARPHKAYVTLEDFVIDLPSSIQAYLNMLGSKTRKTIRHRLRQLERGYPSYSFAIVNREDVTDSTIAEIIRFQRIRMASKHKTSLINRDYEARIVKLARHCGLVGIARIDGRFAAGAIVYEVGSNYFAHVISHDPQYDSVSLGRLCMFFMISECIARGGRTFHMLWGESGYKYESRGVRRDLVSLTVFRSWRHMVLNPRTWLKNWVKYIRRKAKHRVKGALDWIRRRIPPLAHIPRLQARLRH